MASITLLDFSKQEPRKVYGRYSLGPFPKGMGLNILNPLTVSLKSDLSRVCITYIEFHTPYVSHEYTTIPGLRETTFGFLRNLQEIVFFVNYDVLQITNVTPIKGTLSIEGPMEITAKNLKLPRGLTCVDPQQYIGTLDSNIHIKLDFLVTGPTSFGVFRSTLGATISRDSNGLFTTPMFNPIQQVNMCLEEEIIDGIEMEIGMIEIWTDGSIHPYEAIQSCFSTLATRFWSLFKVTCKDFRMDASFPAKTKEQTEENQLLFAQTSMKMAKKIKVEKQQIQNELITAERVNIRSEKQIDNIILDGLKNNRLGALPFNEMKNFIKAREQANLRLRKKIQQQVIQQVKLENETLDGFLDSRESPKTSSDTSKSPPAPLIGYGIHTSEPSDPPTLEEKMETVDFKTMTSRASKTSEAFDTSKYPPGENASPGTPLTGYKLHTREPSDPPTLEEKMETVDFKTMTNKASKTSEAFDTSKFSPGGNASPGTPLTGYGIPTRTLNVLATNEIYTLETLQEQTEETLKSIKGIGKKGLEALMDVIWDKMTGK